MPTYCIRYRWHGHVTFSDIRSSFEEVKKLYDVLMKLKLIEKCIYLIREQYDDISRINGNNIPGIASDFLKKINKVKYPIYDIYEMVEGVDVFDKVPNISIKR